MLAANEVWVTIINAQYKTDWWNTFYSYSLPVQKLLSYFDERKYLGETSEEIYFVYPFFSTIIILFVSIRNFLHEKWPGVDYWSKRFIVPTDILQQNISETYANYFKLTERKSSNCILLKRKRDLTILFKARLGVDFTNILSSAYVCPDFKSTKRHWWLDCLFALLGSAHV